MRGDEVDENGETVEIVIDKRWITGSVETLKVDAEYPDATLPGADFDIYADVNNNGIYDKGIDLLVGNMQEMENGL